MDTTLLRKRTAVVRSHLLLQLLVLLEAVDRHIKVGLKRLDAHLTARQEAASEARATRRRLQEEFNSRPSTQLWDYYEEEASATVGKVLGTVALMALIMGAGPLVILGSFYLFWLFVK